MFKAKLGQTISPPYNFLFWSVCPFCFIASQQTYPCILELPHVCSAAAQCLLELSLVSPMETVKHPPPHHQFSFLCTCTNVAVGYWNLWLCNSYSDSVLLFQMDVLLSCCRLENSLSLPQIKREELSDLNFQIWLSIEERNITHLPVCRWGVPSNAAKGTTCTAFTVSAPLGCVTEEGFNATCHGAYCDSVFFSAYSFDLLSEKIIILLFLCVPKIHYQRERQTGKWQAIAFQSQHHSSSKYHRGDVRKQESKPGREGKAETEWDEWEGRANFHNEKVIICAVSVSFSRESVACQLFARGHCAGAAMHTNSLTPPPLSEECHLPCFRSHISNFINT